MQATANRFVVISRSACGHESVSAFREEISSNQAKDIVLNISNVKIINGKIEAIIVVSNNSSVSFNTVSAVGNPVRLSWRLIQISPSGERISEPGWDARQDLMWTIAPGDSKKVRISPSLPPVSGNYLLEVSLVQEGIAWLHQLGMGIPGHQLRLNQEALK